MIRVRSSSCIFFSFAVRTFSAFKEIHQKNMLTTWNHSGVNSPCTELRQPHTLTLFAVPLPTGGWHSQACRMAHSMISTSAVSWRSVRATNHKHRKLLTIWWKGLPYSLWTSQRKKRLKIKKTTPLQKKKKKFWFLEWMLTLLSRHGLIQQQADHSFPVLQQLWPTLPQAVHQVGPMFMKLENRH